MARAMAVGRTRAHASGAQSRVSRTGHRGTVGNLPHTTEKVRRRAPTTIATSADWLLFDLLCSPDTMGRYERKGVIGCDYR